MLELKSLFDLPVEWLAQIHKFKTLIPIWMDSAKTYLNLSSAALIVTLAFRKIILPGAPRITLGVWLSWICFVVSIGFASLYQYCAISYLEKLYKKEKYELFGIIDIEIIYGAILFSFYCGVISYIATTFRDYYKTPV